MANARRQFEYVLGDHAREASRLRAQARLWDPVSHALFDRLGVKRGWKVLEIGPGQGSLHMELRRRVGGTVDAVERSAAFAEHLERRVRRDGLGPSRIFFSDLADWLSLEYVGPAHAWDEEVVTGSMDDGAFAVHYLQDGIVRDALSIGGFDDLEAARRLIVSGEAVGADGVRGS